MTVSTPRANRAQPKAHSHAGRRQATAPTFNIGLFGKSRETAIYCHDPLQRRFKGTRRQKIPSWRGGARLSAIGLATAEAPGGVGVATFFAAGLSLLALVHRPPARAAGARRIICQLHRGRWLVLVLRSARRRREGRTYAGWVTTDGSVEVGAWGPRHRPRHTVRCCTAQFERERHDNPPWYSCPRPAAAFYSLHAKGEHAAARHRASR